MPVLNVKEPTSSLKDVTPEELQLMLSIEKDSPDILNTDEKLYIQNEREAGRIPKPIDYEPFTRNKDVVNNYKFAEEFVGSAGLPTLGAIAGASTAGLAGAALGVGSKFLPLVLSGEASGGLIGLGLRETIEEKGDINKAMKNISPVEALITATAPFAARAITGTISRVARFTAGGRIAAHVLGAEKAAKLNKSFFSDLDAEELVLKGQRLEEFNMPIEMPELRKTAIELLGKEVDGIFTGTESATIKKVAGGVLEDLSGKVPTAPKSSIILPKSFSDDILLKKPIDLAEKIPFQKIRGGYARIGSMLKDKYKGSNVADTALRRLEGAILTDLDNIISNADSVSTVQGALDGAAAKNVAIIWRDYRDLAKMKFISDTYDDVIKESIDWSQGAQPIFQAKKVLNALSHDEIYQKHIYRNGQMVLDPNFNKVITEVHETLQKIAQGLKDVPLPGEPTAVSKFVEGRGAASLLAASTLGVFGPATGAIQAGTTALIAVDLISKSMRKALLTKAGRAFLTGPFLLTPIHNRLALLTQFVNSGIMDMGKSNNTRI